ncbi:transposable element Tcb2 transposase [Trichonephila clavipes]|nr:transposable element Tcb2 transposase [Trichonephila clavipes]
MYFMQRLPGVFFQQDNAWSHTARVLQDCLRTVTTLPWPARSKDLSPVEHIWDHLGRTCMPQCPIVSHRVFAIERVQQDGFVGDIALSRLENEAYERELEEEKEKEKAEQLAKSLEVSAKNFTDSKAKKRHWTSKKLSKQKLRAQKKLRHSGKNRRKNLVHNRPKRAATARPERLWDRAVIPYDIESNFSDSKRPHQKIARCGILD